jgi:ferric-dicitrate binding protein FerR (iron transport regulator)
MDNKNTIQDLLEKFKAGILTPEESAQLSLLIKQGDDSKSLKETMTDYWNLSDPATEFPSREMWLRIDSKIQSQQESQTGKGKMIIYFRNFAKYAAIILVTVALTWFARNIADKSGTTSGITIENMKYNEVSVSFGSKSRIVLPDGSVVILNSGSKLRYPAQFASNTRDVYLEGEGFFEVEESKSKPFLVRTKDITVRVLGTKFNLKSYDDEKIIETTLISGKVEIFANKDEKQREQKKIVLEPNQQALFYKESDDISLSQLQSRPAESEEISVSPVEIKSKVDIVEIIAWKDNRLVFKNEKFNELATKLERWYDVKIEIKDEELKHILFTGTFQKESIEQALSALKLIIPFRYEMKMNQIVITKNN